MHFQLYRFILMPNLIDKLLLLTNGGKDFFFCNIFLSNRCSKKRGRTDKGKKSMARKRKWKVRRLSDSPDRLSYYINQLMIMN